MAKKKKIAPQVAINKLDTEKLGEVMKGLVASLLSGTPVDTKEVSIELKVPEPVYQIIEETCKVTGASVKDVFSAMASKGLTNSLQGIVGEGAKVAESIQEEVKEEKPQESQGFDMSKITEQFAGLQTFAEQLQGLSKSMESINDGVGTGFNVSPKVPKDTK